jgi:dihydroorotate dehydrogenase (fumarate)
MTTDDDASTAAAASTTSRANGDTGTCDLSTRYLGLELANPIVAAASPMTGEIDRLCELEEAGVAAVVLPSLFEEQIEHDVAAMHGLEVASERDAEVYGGYLPVLETYNTGPAHYLETLVAAKAELAVPVIASLNGTSEGGWIHYAKVCEDEGADALELNIYLVAADLDVAGTEVEDRYLALVAAIRDAVTVPLAVKIGPYFSSPGHMARRLVDAGANGLVLFNRFMQPDIDLDTLTTTPRVVLSSPDEMRLVLRWMAILSGRIDASLAATTGVHDAEGVVKLLLAGADVTTMASALLQHGAGHVAVVLDEMQRWFDDHDYVSVTQARGSLSQRSSPDPSAFERANYMKALSTWS